MQAGEGEIPTNELMEKQRLIIDRLRDRIELDVDGLDRLAPDELQRAVDSAVKRVSCVIQRYAAKSTVTPSPAADHADEGEGPGDTAAEDANHRPRALRRVPAAREPEQPAVHLRQERGAISAFRVSVSMGHVRLQKASCPNHSEAAKRQRLAQAKALGFNKNADRKEPPSSINSTVALLQMHLYGYLQEMILQRLP